jgi:hypothetical protein
MFFRKIQTLRFEIISESFRGLYNSTNLIYHLIRLTIFEEITEVVVDFFTTLTTK